MNDAYAKRITEIEARSKPYWDTSLNDADVHFLLDCLRIYEQTISDIEDYGNFADDNNETLTDKAIARLIERATREE